MSDKEPADTMAKVQSVKGSETGESGSPDAKKTPEVFRDVESIFEVKNWPFEATDWPQGTDARGPQDTVES